MNNISYHINYHICEASIEAFKTTRWRSYIEFCKALTRDLNSERTDVIINRHTTHIQWYLHKIYGFDMYESFAYMTIFFNNSEYLKFYDIVRLTTQISQPLKR